MKYRPEIDGLRAIAVLSVIFFHADFSVFGGGFVGVDIFFVISGFLITTIIFEQKTNKDFDIFAFYEKRARRILPALFFVILVCIPFAWLWLIPDDLIAFSKSVSTAIFSVSNILFWRESGYFAPAAEMKPLLHTWSLAVEEQYYILFPVFLTVIWKYGKNTIFFILLFISSLSFLLTNILAIYRPTFNFYMLPTRGWEILLGSLLAIYKFEKENTKLSNLIRYLLSITGLLLILYAIIRFDSNTPFPSYYALLPTVGTVLIILFISQGTILYKLLANKVLVGIGLISYSLYLWHFPLFVFYKHRSFNVSESGFAFLICLSFILSYLTWRFIEKPFRKKQLYPFPRFRKIILGVLSTLLIFSYLVTNNKGFDNRLSHNEKMLLGGINDRNPSTKACSYTKKKNLKNGCLLGSNIQPTGALIGDSHADAIAHALHKDLQITQHSLSYIWSGGCPPIQNMRSVKNINSASCMNYNNQMFSDITKYNNFEYIVMVGRYTAYIEGNTFDNYEGGKEAKVDVRGIDATYATDIITNKNKINEQLRIKGLANNYKNSVMKYLNAGKKVVLVYPIPEVGWHVPKEAAKRIMFQASSKTLPISTSYQRYLERNKTTINILDNIGQHKNLIRVFPDKVLCNTYIEDRCIATLDGKALYYDDDHLSNYGASLITPEIIRTIQVLESQGQTK